MARGPDGKRSGALGENWHQMLKRKEHSFKWSLGSVSQVECLVSERQCRLSCAAGDTPAGYIYLVYSLTCLKCKYHSGVNTHTTCNSYILRYLFKKNKKNVCTRALLLNVPTSVLSSGSNLEAVQRPSRYWINKIQYNNKKEPGAVNTLHRNELHKHAMSKTPGAKDNVVYISFHVKCPEKTKRKNKSTVANGGLKLV